LNAQIQQLKVQIAENENTHYSQIENKTQEHYQEINTKIVYEKSTEDDYNKTVSTREQSHID